MNGVSRAVLVATVLLLPALSSAQEGSKPSKSGFDYNYAELSYDKHDFDVSRAPDNIDGDGFTLSGSFKVGADWHVYASYGTANVDFGIDVDTWALGLGYSYSVKPNVDLYGRVLYIDQSASSGVFSASTSDTSTSRATSSACSALWHTTSRARAISAISESRTSAHK